MLQVVKVDVGKTPDKQGVPIFSSFLKDKYPFLKHFFENYHRRDRHFLLAKGFGYKSD